MRLLSLLTEGAADLCANTGGQVDLLNAFSKTLRRHREGSRTPWVHDTMAISRQQPIVSGVAR